jgi:hypothetical protein
MGVSLPIELEPKSPGMVREGNFISVTDGLGDEIYQIPLASVTV